MMDGMLFSIRARMNLILVALLSLLAGSCSSPKKSFYLLTPEGPAPSTSGPGIGVGPVSLASYLAHSNIVFQESDHRFTLAESNIWAGDLDDNIAHVVSVDLGRQLHSGNVRTYPWGDDNGLRYQVALDIRQFHANASGDAILDVTWRVYSLPDRAILSTRSWSATESLKSDGYDALVSAESRLLGRLSAEIARGLK